MTTTATPAPPRGAAHFLAPLAGGLFNGVLPVRLRAWDGSESGPADAPLVVLRDRDALRHILARPGELGLARAYVTGSLDVEGDVTDALRRVWASVREHGTSVPGPAEWARAARTLLALGVVGTPPPVPLAEARMSGRLHSRERDAAAVSHHYDAGNDLYELFLDESMAYSCAYWTSDEPGYTLADAQRDKLDLVCRELGLEGGERLLDRQVSRRGAQPGGGPSSSATSCLVFRPEVNRPWFALCARGPVLSVLSVGEKQARRYVAAGRGGDFKCLRRQGKTTTFWVGHQPAKQEPADAARRSVPTVRQGLQESLPFAVGRTSNRPRHALHPWGDDRVAGGARRRACMSNYVRTARAWLEVLERRFDELVSLAGPQAARVWRLYLAGGALAFEEGRMGVDQILAERPAHAESRR